MKAYVPWRQKLIAKSDAKALKEKLAKAQAEIERLKGQADPRLTSEEQVRQVRAQIVEHELHMARELEWTGRIRELEEKMEDLKTDCVPGSIWGHDINEKSSPGGMARFREAHEAKVLERLKALEKQVNKLKAAGGGTPNRRMRPTGRREFDKSVDPLGWGRRGQLDRRATT